MWTDPYEWLLATPLLSRSRAEQEARLPPRETWDSMDKRSFALSNASFRSAWTVLNLAAFEPEPVRSLALEIEKHNGEDDRLFPAYAAIGRVLFLKPEQHFLDFVGTVAALELDELLVDLCVLHGWPILSLRLRNATIAGGGTGGNPLAPGALSEAAA